MEFARLHFEDGMLLFPPFILEPENYTLRRGAEIIPLAPKSYAVLLHLVENAGRLISKQELLGAVWPGTYIHEAVLKTSILEIRKALADDATNPKYIKTRHRRGYQFIAPVVRESTAGPVVSEHGGVLGREEELARLDGILQVTLRGSREIAFIAGEAGIGKTALVEMFLTSETTTRSARVARGHCVEHFGDREPYYPLLDALSRAAGCWEESDLVHTLFRYAPTWLLQMPALVPAGEVQALRQICLGSTRQRMLRELSEALEVLAANKPLILALEDLHWSDVATMDLIAWISNRPMKAPLLLIGTYRPLELMAGEHPLRALQQELGARRMSTSIHLGILSRPATGAFLARRFVPNDFPEEFGDVMYRVTDGHPLFLVNATEYAITRSLVAQVNGCWSLQAPLSELQSMAPENVVEMIARQIDRLTAQEQAVLEAASLSRDECRADWLAEVTDEDAIVVEQVCEHLAQRNLFLRIAGEASVRERSQYVFIHSLYREAFYRRLPPGRRQHLHRRFGECIERSAGEHDRDFISELASHFQRSDQPRRALHYLGLAAEHAAQLQAPSEAVALFQQAFTQIARLPKPEQAACEIGLVEELGLVYRLMGQFAEAAQTFQRMVERAALAGDLHSEIRGCQALAGVLSWFDRERCLECVNRIAALSSQLPDEHTRVVAQGHIGYWNLLFKGWNDEDATASERAMDFCQRQGDDPPGLAWIQARHAFFLNLRSDYRGAVSVSSASLSRALEVESFTDYSLARYYQAWALLHLGEWGAMRRVLADAMSTAERNGHRTWTLLFRLLEVWLHIEAFSFGAAIEQGEDCLREARVLPHPLSEQISLVLLGLAHTGAGDCDKAAQYFRDIVNWQSRERILMDWIWKVPLQEGVCELHLRRREWDAAIREAQVFRTMTEQTAEVTWRARACWIHGRAMAATNPELAVRAIRDGEEVIGGRGAPLAEWRLLALAVEIDGGGQRSHDAREAIHRLANSLNEDERLRHSFLNAEPVASVLRAAPAIQGAACVPPL